jgi:hypothetical protein
MHERKNVDCLAVLVADQHVYDQVREPTDGVGAAHVVRIAEARETRGGLQNVSHALTHLGEETHSETWNGILVPGRSLLELRLGVRLDVEPVHLPRSFASMSSNT